MQSSTSFGRLQRLTEPTHSDLAATFRRMGEVLSMARASKPYQVQVSMVTDGSDASHWRLSLSKGKAQVAQTGSDKCDVEIITSPATWWAIAEGRQSPVEAFVKGLLRVRGNLQLAKRVFLHDLAAVPPAELPVWLR